GLTGLLGAKGVEALAALLPEGWSGWGVLGLTLVCLGGGTTLAARVFAFDWGQLFTFPAMLRRVPRADADPFLPGRERAKRLDEPPLELADNSNRKPPEIADPSLPPRAAKAGKTKQ